MAFNEMNLQYWDALENLQSGQLEVVIVSCEGNLYWLQIHLVQSDIGCAACPSPSLQGTPQTRAGVTPHLAKPTMMATAV